MENAKLPKNETLRAIVKDHFLDDVIEEYGFKKTFEGDRHIEVHYKTGNFNLVIGEWDFQTRLGWWNKHYESMEYPREGQVIEREGFEAQIAGIVEFIEEYLAR